MSCRLRVVTGSCPRRVLLAVLLLAPGLAAQDPGSIFQGVRNVYGAGAVGPITGLPGKNVRGMIAGDDDSSLPSLFAALGTLGSGHALAVGHEGILSDAANAVLDTRRFNVQALQWLDRNGRKVVGVSAGHGEWLRLRHVGSLSAALGQVSYQTRELSGTLTAATLSGLGVLIVGNAWQDFTAAEVNAVEAFVRAGGGLYLCGLGWSWTAYKSPKTLDQYPMNVLGERFGLRFIGGTISDPTNRHNGGPVFHTFYPACDLHLPALALTHHQTLLGAHALDLSAYLGANAVARRDWLVATAALAAGLGGLPVQGGYRALLDGQVRTIVQAYPRWFGMGWQFDQQREAPVSLGRAVLQSGLVAAFPLDATRVATLVTALDFKLANADYLELFRSDLLLLLDNRRLDAAQRRFILDHMKAVRGVPRLMRRMTVKDFLGSTSPDLSRAFQGPGVNVFGMRMNRFENGFPKDVPALPRPTFAIVVAHESAHSIHAAMSQTSTGYKSKHDQLLRDAGTDDLQYLRSMVGGAFFQKNPQEFIASNANQWLMDSVHTLRLGFERLRAGKREPILQALFMLDLYGQGQSTAPLFATSRDGRLTTATATLRRDGLGRVTEVSSDPANVWLAYDAPGKVRAFASALRYGEPSPQLGVELTTTAAPKLGDPTFALTGTAPAVFTPGILLLGAVRTDVPSRWPELLGSIYVDPASAILFPLASDATGKIRFGLPLANDPALRGIRFYVQAWMLRPNPNGSDTIGVSAGMGLTLGS